MTTIGKILVIVNFIFSLVTGALILAVFYVSTNWEVGYNKLKAFYDVSQANAKSYAAEALEAKNLKEATEKKLNVDLGKRDDVIKDREAKIAVLTADNAKKEEQLKLAALSTQSVTAELMRVKEEQKAAAEKVKDREAEIVKLSKLAKEQQDKAIQANIKARSFQERSENLATALEEINRQFENFKTGKTTGRGVAERRPPPEDVEGVVKSFNTGSGLVTISIGSDAGVSKGNSLYVYRLAPKPLYLGEIQILEVNAHEAVGRPVNMAQKSSQLQNGDRVAASIMNQR